MTSPFALGFGFNFWAGVIFSLSVLAWICLIGYVIPRMEVSGKAKFWMIFFSVLFAVQSVTAAGLVITGAVRVVPGGEPWAYALLVSSFAILSAMWACFWDFIHYWYRRRERDEDE